ncbi:MOSC N-terminal beta barrel domain-containing protein [Paenibacillus sp. FSL H8-0537]|uniref:MOSC domain-containing protein n=1 Tax=Paenibacillus sp. FSL H8-0537 TaxID=2921399 RepID=UPI003100D6DD
MAEKPAVGLVKTRIGTIKEMNRYPIKSFAGERLTSSRVETYGLYGDRSHAFIDETKQGWDSFITARQIPAMLGYRAKLQGNADCEKGTAAASEFPEVTVTSPDNRELAWSEQLLAEIQAHTRTTITMRRYAPQTLDLLGADASSVLIVTDALLSRLEAMWGKPLDARRFRANLIVALAGDAPDEDSWIGKRLQLGSAELRVDEHCERCSMIALDPDTQERDMSLLKKVNQELNLHVGLYASVTKMGLVHVGDELFLLSDD